MSTPGSSGSKAEGRELFARTLNVSRETMARFDQWQALLQQWSRRINLVSKGALDDFWIRHALDGAQLAALAPKTTRRWIDLGAGAGFPGLAVALVLMERDPVDMVLVESNAKKTAFLRAVIAKTGAPAQVICARAEAVSGEACDVLSARALAPLPQLLSLSAPFCGPNTLRLFPKGESVLKELEDARRDWVVEAEILPSCTRKGAAILRIGQASRA